MMNDTGNACSRTSNGAPRLSVLHWHPFPIKRLFLRKYTLNTAPYIGARGFLPRLDRDAHVWALRLWLFTQCKRLKDCRQRQRDRRLCLFVFSDHSGNTRTDGLTAFTRGVNAVNRVVTSVSLGHQVAKPHEKYPPILSRQQGKALI